ncbi:MAG: hypothetical protein PHV18_12165 [Lachnospiraceae bacterium]|nr:hypothetical protein [Lachnospiraceae bacterium]
MAKIFRFTHQEISLMMMIMDMETIKGFDQIIPLDVQDIAVQCKESLIRKKYLLEDQDKKITVSEAMELDFEVMKTPYGFLVMDYEKTGGSHKRMVMYFRDDAIICVSKEDEYEVLWIPFLPLAIGAISNWVGSFRNNISDLSESCDIQTASKLWSEYCNHAADSEIWRFTGYENRKEDLRIDVIGTKTEQILFHYKEDKVIVSRPDQVQWMNTIIRWIAPIHGKAIKAGM